MKDVKIGIPGSLDGPPDKERTTLVEGIFIALAVAFCFAFATGLIVAVAWATAWMVTHFPTL